MTRALGGTARGRQATAAAISVAYLAVGVALAVLATPVESHLSVPDLLISALLVPVYVAAHHYSLDFEFRRESNSVTLVQLPLAFGLYLVSPLAHLATRLVASLLYSAMTRQDRLKALFNLAAAGFEVGAAALAVGLVAPDETGPVMWLALYGGLLAGDVAGALVLNAIWRRLGMQVSLRQTARNLLLVAPVGFLFTAIAIVAINAARVEALTAVVMLGLALWVGAGLPRAPAGGCSTGNDREAVRLRTRAWTTHSPQPAHTCSARTRPRLAACRAAGTGRSGGGPVVSPPGVRRSGAPLHHRPGRRVGQAGCRHSILRPAESSARDRGARIGHQWPRP
jgi:hypothetical protein